MQDPDFVVNSFHQSKADFVVWMAIRSNTFPMGFNHVSELPIRLQPLPLQRVFPALEEGTSTPFGAVVPELSEGFLENVGRIQAAVDLEQFLQGPSPVQVQVLTP